MNVNIDLTPFFQALIGLLAAAITCFVIPWIHARTTEAQQKNLKAVVRVLVYAAEQMFGGGAGEQKLNFVREQLQERGYDVDLEAIEAAVRECFPHWDEDEDGEEPEDGGEDYALPLLEDWPLEMIVAFCRDNLIPCEGCQTREEYVRAIRGKPPENDTDA